MIDISFVSSYKNFPKRENRFLKILAKLYFFFFKWSLKGNIPDVEKAIVIVGPHTSNWDFVHLVMLSFLLEVKVSWFGKHTIFRKPFGGILSYIGGIPVERGKHHSFVKKMVEEFKKNERFILALSPEGTRKPVKDLKTGFFYIAKELNIPVTVLGVDYKKKIFEFNEPMYFKNTEKNKAIEQVKEIFRKYTPKHPEKFAL